MIGLIWLRVGVCSVVVFLCVIVWWCWLSGWRGRLRFFGGLWIIVFYLGVVGRVVVLVVLGVSVFVVVFDGVLFCCYFVLDYFVFYIGLLVLWMFVMSLLVCIEEFKFCLLLMMVLVVFVVLVWCKFLVVWFVVIILVV